MKPKKVVVTGLGTINPLGNSVEETWKNLCLGKSGISRVEGLDTEIASKIAGQVKNFDVFEYLDRKEARKMDQYCHYALVSAIQAMKDADLDSIQHMKLGVITGTGIGGMQTFEHQTAVFLQKGPRKVSPFFIPKMISNIAAGRIAIHFNARGINFNITSACASSANAIGEAYRAIKFGAADVVIACGSEAAVTPFTLAGFSAMRALSVRNDSPETASRPFDLERDGFVLSEGGGTIILEEYDHAKKRGAKIYAEMVGYGATSDAFHITMPAPNGAGGAQAMRNALQDANIQPQDIQYINAHGTSTPLNDKCETAAVKTVFGEHAYKLKINSSKSMMGHTLGGAGAIEAMILIKSIQEQKIHPTINLFTPDPECDLDYNPKKTIDLQIEYGMSNSFGFGGHNAVLIFKGID
ncbi:MAG: beta-ketoacyl-ACP synthase II [Candidatus Cloacimonadota bacterium]|nr:beta-ketoacyl-ACP synthase II [Candidatus Cloacimonadota bacterium]